MHWETCAFLGHLNLIRNCIRAVGLQNLEPGCGHWFWASLIWLDGFVEAAFKGKAKGTRTPLHRRFRATLVRLFALLSCALLLVPAEMLSHGQLLGFTQAGHDMGSTRRPAER